MISDNDNITVGERLLKKCGFCLYNSQTIKIEDELEYVVYEYAQLQDMEKMEGCEMTINFDPSQNSIEVWDRYGVKVWGKVFLNSDIILAVQIRAKELGMIPDIKERVKTTFNCPIDLRDRLEDLVNEYIGQYTADEIMEILLTKALKEDNLFS